jgi:archaellum component FlaC
LQHIAACGWGLCLTLALIVSVVQGDETASSDESAAPSLATRIDGVIDKDYVGPTVPLASDSEFLRRIYLDLVGRGPSVDETRAFLLAIETNAKSSADARRELIDELLSREEFSRHYATVLEVMFTERREAISLRELRALIRQWLEDRRPLNELCLEMLAADGTGRELRAAASFILNRKADPHLVTRDIGRIFFGRDVQCAQCHDHPLVADYEQSEYFGILSFVHRTYLFEDEKRNKLQLLGEKGDGVLEFASVFKPEEGKTPAQPVLPVDMAMDAEPGFVDDADAYLVAPDKEHRGVPRYSRRQQLAVLATHRENLSFNRNLANRLWAHMMGTGVVHPVDMHHIGNPPSSAALLRLLSQELVAGGYDLREFLRQIARSGAYQRSVIAPSLESWAGPAGGKEGIETRLLTIHEELSQLGPQLDQVNAAMQGATQRLQQAQQDVDRLQRQIDEAKTAFQKLVEQHTQAAAKLTELQSKQTKQKKLIASLTAAVGEAEKILTLTPDDHELKASKELLLTRLTAAKEAMPAIDNRVSEQQEVADEAKQHADDQRSRIHSLTNRRLALGEFVVEARGVQRRVRTDMQSVIDQKTDLEQRQRRLMTIQDCLGLKVRIEQAETIGDSAAIADLQRQLDVQQQQLVEKWRRSFAIRQVRGLTPEQMAGATYTALELDKNVRAKALAKWEEDHRDNPAERDDVRRRELFVNTALAVDGPWEMLEDLIVERFSAPAGAPQDGFFATVDQALVIQNFADYQNLLKPHAGNLTERLIAIDNPQQVAEDLYLSILCRRPDDEEKQMVASLLSQHAAERESIVQELVWGLLSSSEFRFSP